MLGKDQIDAWTRQGLISAEQAEKLLATLPEHERATSPLVARVLFAAGALNGLVLYLFSRLHGIDASAHSLVLLWIVSLAPIAYVIRSGPFTVLLSASFFAWIGLFVHGGASVLDATDRLVFLPATYLAAGVFVFALGATHDVLPSLRSVSRTYRLAGLQVATLALFALCVERFGGRATAVTDWRRAEASDRFLIALLVVCGVAAALTILNRAIAARLPSITKSETPVCLAMLVLVVLYAVVPLPPFVYLLLWNAVLLAMGIVSLTTGLKRRDARLVDIGVVGLSGLVVARYVDAAWDRLPLATFVLVLAVLLGACVAALFFLRPGADDEPEEKKAETPAPTETSHADPEVERLLQEARAKDREG